jgi:hypothetical protein
VYIRSSPIICALDAIFLLVRILISPFLLGLTVRQVIRSTIRERYNNIDDMDGDLQSLKKQTWLRWIFFLVGTLGPIIKLATMQGVPWTKTWGMMFLGAFVVFEGMVFVSTKDIGLREEGYLAAQNENAPLPSGFIQCDADDFKATEQFLFSAGLIIQCVVLIWAVIDMWRLRGPVLEQVCSVISILGLLSIFAGFLLMTGYSFFWLCLTIGEGDWIVAICTFVFFLLCGCAGLLGYRGVETLMPLFRRQWYDFLVFLSICGFIPILRFCIVRLCAISRRLGMSLLVISYSEDVAPGTIDEDALFGLTFFLVNFFICFLWYWLKYNPEGTGIPNWTEMFG